MNAEFKSALETVVAGRGLSCSQSHAAFSAVMSGEIADVAIGALLGAIAIKGETVDELVGAAQAMREKAVRIACNGDCIDTCGTGGDGISTFNVSTTAAVIAAAAGATVAKHGNRSTTRASGSTDVLERLGIDAEASTDVVERCLADVRIGYLNARNLHPAMRYAAPVRQALPTRTIFNLLGPLTNPAGARRQLLGVPKPDLVDKMAEALAALGAVHAWVIHGTDGLCDVTITGTTLVAEVREGAIRRFEISPADVGLRRTSLDALRVGSARESAGKVLAIFRGERGGARDHALMNAGAALVVAGKVEQLADGVALASHTIDAGQAMATLDGWRVIGGHSRSDGGAQV